MFKNMLGYLRDRRPVGLPLEEPPLAKALPQEEDLSKTPLAPLAKKRGLLEHPLAPLFQGQYPLLEKYGGEVPSPSTGKSNQEVQELLSADNEAKMMQAGLNRFSPAQMLNPANMPARIVGTTPGEQERLDAGYQAQAANRAFMEKMAGMVPGIAQERLTQDRTLAGQKDLQAGQIASQEKMKTQDIWGELQKARLQAGSARDASLQGILGEMFKSGQPIDDRRLEGMINLLNSSRGFNTEQKLGGVDNILAGMPGIPEGLGPPPGLPAQESLAGGQTEDPLEKMRASARQLNQLAQSKADPALVDKIIQLIGGNEYTPRSMVENLSANANLMNDEVTRNRILNAWKARFGLGTDPERQLAYALARLHREANIRNWAGIPEASGVPGKEYPADQMTYGAGTRLQRDTTPVSEAYKVQGPGYSWDLPHWVSLPMISGRISPYEDSTWTWKPATKEQYRKQADVVARFLEGLNAGR